jgi:hypothetical protein
MLNYDTFTIKDTLGRAVELYVLEVDPQKHGIVGPGTVIHCDGDPLSGQSW